MEGKLALQILTLTCLWWYSMARPTSHNDFQSLLRTAVDRPKLRDSSTSRISGPNGYCIDVKGSNYTYGNPIILWTCMSDQVNQLWTFESNGTLQSNGKCLTPSGYSQGSYVTIDDCLTAEEDTTLWELKGDGEIVHTKTGFSLTGLSGTAGSTLTLEMSISSSSQTWRVSNDTEPSLVNIIGYKDLCLTTSNTEVWVANCSSDSTLQQWLLYPDGTIRPKTNTKLCVGYDNLVNSVVVVQTCGLGPSGQRWMFDPLGYIYNERLNLVVDVKKSDPSLNTIILYMSTGNANQLWKTSLLS